MVMYTKGMRIRCDGRFFVDGIFKDGIIKDIKKTKEHTRLLVLLDRGDVVWMGAYSVKILK